MSLRFLGQDIGRRLKNINAGVSELADETDSKSTTPFHTTVPQTLDFTGVFEN